MTLDKLYACTDTDCSKQNDFSLALASDGEADRLHKEMHRLRRAGSLSDAAYRNHRRAYTAAVNAIGNKAGFNWNSCQTTEALEHNAVVLHARNKAMGYATHQWCTDAPPTPTAYEQTHDGQNH